MFNLYNVITLFLLACLACENSNYTLDQKQRTFADSVYEEARKLASQSKYDSAISVLNIALKIYIELDSTRKISNALSNKGLYHYYQGHYDSSRYFYDLALTYDSLIGGIRLIRRFRNIGILEKKRGRFLDAIRAYNKGLETANRFDNQPEKASLNYSIGNLLNKQKRYEDALVYHREAFVLWGTLKDELRTGRSANNIGNDLLGLNMIDSAIYYYRLALKLKVQADDPATIPSTLNNLGEAYLKLGKLDSASYYLHKSEQLKLSSGNVPSLLITTNNLAELYFTEKDWTKTLQYLNYDTTKLTNPDTRLQNLDIRSRYHEQIGEYKLALRFHEKWSALQDSLFEEGRLATLTEVAATEKADLTYQKQLSDQRAQIERNKRLIQAAALAGLGLLLGVITFFFFRNQKQKKLIEALNQQLVLLNRDMLHRKRNDYTRIINTLESINFPAADNVQNMLLASASLDEALYNESSIKTNLQGYLKRVITDISEALNMEERKIYFDYSIASVSVSGEFATRIGFIICELITNSSKHSFKNNGGLIRITLQLSEKQLTCLYEENGQKFQDEVTKEHTGMGLGLIQEFLTKLDSEITRDYQDEWNLARFVVSLP